MKSSDAPLSPPPPPQARCHAERLLLVERETLIPLLRWAPEAWFAHGTACPGWTVRDVIAHCAAALTRIAEDRLHDFSPECNQRDVLDRKDWPVRKIVDELDTGYVRAAPAIAAADGELDVIALGEWVHAGDVRAAFGITPAYATEGTPDALALLATVSRIRDTPLLTADLPGRRLRLGTWLPDQHQEARLTADAETLIRLYTGRPVEGHAYTLTGAAAPDLVIYR